MAESMMVCQDPEPEPVFQNSNWCVTKLDVLRFNDKWNLEHFMSWPQLTGEYVSRRIPTEDKSHIDWHLRVYPNGLDENYKEYVSVLIFASITFQPNPDELFNPDDYKFDTRISIELLDSSNDKLFSQSKNVRFQVYTEDINIEDGFRACIKRDALQTALKNSINGTLTIVCTIDEYTGFKNVTSPSGLPIQKPIVETHSRNVLKKALTDQLYTDCTINVKDRQFKVHKHVLHICSSYWSTELNEKENEITVENIEPEIFEKILEFMYTGNVASIKDCAMELVPVARKYDLKELLEQCEAELCSQISMATAVKLFMFSNNYPLKHLKRATIDYIKAFLDAISETAEWKTYIENDLDLLMLLS